MRVRIASALCLLAALSALAQDAGQVLRLSVGFRTMKNTVQMTDEKRKEVEALEAKARAAAGHTNRLGGAAAEVHPHHQVSFPA